MKRYNFDHMAKINARLAQIAQADYEPLMIQWAFIIKADNRRGVLAGLDKDGSPMTPVRYRPKLGTGGKAGPKNRKKDRGYKGFGPMASGLHGNLSSSEYRKLDGPPLAPRRTNSRVITNLRFERGRNGSVWWVEAFWQDVVSTSGISFLPYHFLGLGRLPVRNLAGIRPEGRAKAQRSLKTYALRLARGKTDFVYADEGDVIL